MWVLKYIDNTFRCKTMTTEKNEKFRFDHASGAVYEYSRENKCYIFCGNLLNRSESQFIKDFEEQENVAIYNRVPWGAPYGAPDCEDTDDDELEEDFNYTF